jgi:hypothetical protein
MLGTLQIVPYFGERVEKSLSCKKEDWCDAAPALAHFRMRAQEIFQRRP